MIAEFTGGRILATLESKGFPVGKITDMFPDPLVMLDLPKGERLILAPFRCMDPVLGLDFEVPPGFVCDLASIPGFITPILPKIGNHDKAAVGHDYLFRTQLCPRSTADRFFLHGMADQGVELWRRQAMYGGVRIGGWRQWNKNAKILARKTACRVNNAFDKAEDTFKK